MRSYLPAVGVAGLLAMLTACSAGGPDRDYPRYLPPTVALPPMPDTPRAYVPKEPGRTAGGAGVGPTEAEAGRGEFTCRAYCSAFQSACDYHVSALSRTLAQCQADCSAWPQGTAGDRGTDTLACRAHWTQEAAMGVERACWNAGTSSAACLLGDEAVRAPALRQRAHTVLGLYDSTDARSWDGGKRARRTILGGRVRFALRKLGLKISVWNMRKGLPPRDLVERSVAIVTAFYDAKLPDARGYGAWLRSQIEAGRRVVILNNYGAWRETGGGFVDERIPNLVFEALGVRYEAQWTNQGRLLARSENHVDRSMFERLPNPVTARHYYLFRPLSSDVRIHLGITRSDLRDSLSAVVMTSPRGGMAISRYYENRDGDPQVALSRFLRRAILSR